MLSRCQTCKTGSDLRAPCSGCADTFCEKCFKRHRCVLGANADDKRQERGRTIKKERWG
jgi:hypothetical protein